VESARARVAAAGLAPVIDIIESDGAKYEAPAESFEATFCLGASWIWGGYRGTLEALTEWTKPGGIILSGEPFWRETPSPEYVEAENLQHHQFGTHLENVRTGTELGLRFLHAIVSSEDDWDRYEGLHSLSAERYAREHPDDPDLPELFERVRPYPEAYLRWGRRELGWAVYMFMKQ
jgi:hypothetical protein